MPENSMYIYELRYHQLCNYDVASHEVNQLVEYFITHEAEREQVGNSVIAAALFSLSLGVSRKISLPKSWGERRDAHEPFL